jgi:glutathione peroxidase
VYKILLIAYGLLAFMTGASAAEGMKTMQDKNAYDFSFQKIDGGDLNLSDYKGKLLLVVNTASRCGFTKQYDGLQSLYEKYKDKGLVVLGVPSNDFMGQEPGSNEEIKKFCQTSFGITFPMAQKVHVKGDEADSFYRWAAFQKNGDVPAWNFHKFLISPDGHLLQAFGSRVAPDSDKLIEAIEAGLPKS